MTPIVAEISAAPHLPASLRPRFESNALADFMGYISRAAEIEVIEENGELYLVSHPITTG